MGGAKGLGLVFVLAGLAMAVRKAEAARLAASEAPSCVVSHDGFSLHCDGGSQDGLPDLADFTLRPGRQSLVLRRLSNLRSIRSVPSQHLYSNITSLSLLDCAQLAHIAPGWLVSLPQLKHLEIRDSPLLRPRFAAFARRPSPLQSLKLEGIDCGSCETSWLGEEASLRQARSLAIPGSGATYDVSDWELAFLPAEIVAQCTKEEEKKALDKCPETPSLELSWEGEEGGLAVGSTTTLQCASETLKAKSMELCLSSSLNPVDRCNHQWLAKAIHRHNQTLSVDLGPLRLVHNVWVQCNSTLGTGMPSFVVKPLIVRGVPHVKLGHLPPTPDQRDHAVQFLIAGFPPPSASWRHNGAPLKGYHYHADDRADQSRNDSRFGARTGYLGFQDLGFLRGEFTLEACNALGCSSASVRVGSDEVLVPLTERPDLPLASSAASGLAWAVPAFSVLSLLLVLLLALLFGRRRLGRAKTGRGGRARYLGEEAVALELGDMRENSMYSFCALGEELLRLPPGVKVLGEAGDLKLLAPLGEGAFGKVYLALHAQTGQRLAAKRLRLSSPERLESLRQEAAHLAKLCHPRVVSFHGLCPDPKEGSVYLLFEYMELGDLRKWLQQRSPELRPRVTSPELSACTASTSVPDSLAESELASLRPPAEEGGDLPVPSTAELLDVAVQVAEGLEYLSENRFVHRDLAARNCLVSAGPSVKISDFGMSRDIYCSDYYRVEGHRLLPVRWMAVEGFLYGRFGTPSDVWSFGVVLWELWSFGRQPWFGLANHEVIAAVKEGATLEPPSNAPPEVRSLMRRLWAFEAEQRPVPKDVLQSLRDARAQLDHV